MLMATVAAVCCLGIFQTSVGHPTGYPTDTIRRQTQQTTGRGEEQPPPPPPQLVLFVDRAQIAAGADARLQLRLQPPAKDGAAVLRPDRPWEAWAIAAWATVVPGSGVCHVAHFILHCFAFCISFRLFHHFIISPFSSFHFRLFIPGSNTL
eukprot:SAG31_NODE_1182_length_9512_cov_3.773611_2_plen_151_part_00